ncbi:MAG: substrate-binding domain-containing protein [Vulcanimicrobiaceae bacterium]
MARIEASRLEELRLAQGLSQRALSAAAGTTRQAIGAIEAGRMQPGVAIALKLARALGTTVEDLFGGDAEPAPTPNRIATATIAGRTVAHALNYDHLAIEPAQSQAPNAFIAGCDLAVGLLSRHAMLHARDLRVLWLAMTNRGALDALARGDVHAAVVHGGDALQRARAMDGLAPFELAGTEEGWLVARGNPLRLRGASDLVGAHTRFVNRPNGAGARRLLDDQLRHAAVDPQRVLGYDRELAGQLDAGRAIAQGFADVAVGMASVARVFDLDFIALREERCVLLVQRSALRAPETRALLDALRSTPYRRDLEALHSYDVTRIGEHIA